jgi:hypothetical protein
MAYSDLLDDEGVNSQFLAVLKPRRRISSWSVFSGSVYESSFTLGQVIAVAIDGVALTEGSSTTLSSGEWFYDVDAETLYVRTTGDTDPTADFVVGTYELYVGTFDAHFPRIPTSAESASNRSVYYDPIIRQSPVLKQTNNDVFFGFLPSQTSQVVLNNAEHGLEIHISDSSFNRADIQVYHWLDELETDNVKLVYQGLMGNIQYNGESVSIATFESLDKFEQEYRSGAVSFFSEGSFPNIDTKFLSRPIRKVYGLVDGFVPVNIDFNSEAPSTSDNRDWVVMSGQSGLADISRTVPASPVSTTTRTYLDDAQGITIGDGVWIDKASDEYVVVTNVDYGSDFIDHAALSVAATTADTVKRGFVSKVTITQQGINYTAFYDRDYTLSTALADGTSGFSFKTTMEANTGLPNTLSPSDRVSCRVYGKANDVTLGGPSFGSDDAKSGNLRDPVVIFIDLLKNLGITESEINTSSFTTAQAAVTAPCGIAIPEASNNDFPKYKDLIVRLLQHTMMRFYVDNDRLFKVTPVDVFTGSAGKTVGDDELLFKSFAYSFNYSDTLSQVNVDYNFREIPEEASASGAKLDRVSSTSETAEYLHTIQKSKTYKSFHTVIDQTEASALADKLRSIFGTRRGLVSFRVKNRFFDSIIADTIDVTRTKMPGFAFDSDTDRTRRVVVTGVDRSLRAVTLSCDDQFGVENNSGDF